MALNANTMAADISAAIDTLSQNPLFQAKCFAGEDVTKETWVAICTEIIKHIRQDIVITIPSLTVNAGISVTGSAGPVPVEGSTSGTGTTVSTSTGVTVQ